MFGGYEEVGRVAGEVLASRCSADSGVVGFAAVGGRD